MKKTQKSEGLFKQLGDFFFARDADVIKKVKETQQSINEYRDAMAAFDESQAKLKKFTATLDAINLATIRQGSMVPDSAEWKFEEENINKLNESLYK